METYTPSTNAINAWKDKNIKAFEQATEEDDEMIFLMMFDYYEYLKSNHGLWRDGFNWLCELDLFESREEIDAYDKEYKPMSPD